MAIKRKLTKVWYTFETMSLCRLVTVLTLFFIASTVVLLVVLRPQKIINALVIRSAGNGPTKFGAINQGLLRAQLQKADISPLLSELGRNFETRVLVYNRVPKCASIYLTRMLYKIGASSQKHYQVTSPYTPGEHPWMDEAQLRQHARWVNSADEMREPVVYIRHEYFVEFERWGSNRQPLYINMIRDPIERFTSFFYFIRFGNKEGDGADVYLTDVERRMTLDECVRLQAKECMQPKWQLIPYFCGQDPMCRQRGTWALDKAKENIEKYYAVVGIVEELETSIEVMEGLLPRYFSGAKQLLSDPTILARNDTLTIGKTPPSEETKNILRTATSIGLEYELYKFVKDRLYKWNEKLKSN